MEGNDAALGREISVLKQTSIGFKAIRDKRDELGMRSSQMRRSSKTGNDYAHRGDPVIDTTLYTSNARSDLSMFLSTSTRRGRRSRFCWPHNQHFLQSGSRTSTAISKPLWMRSKSPWGLLVKREFRFDASDSNSNVNPSWKFNFTERIKEFYRDSCLIGFLGGLKCVQGWCPQENQKIVSPTSRCGYRMYLLLRL